MCVCGPSGGWLSNIAESSNQDATSKAKVSSNANTELLDDDHVS